MCLKRRRDWWSLILTEHRAMIYILKRHLTGLQNGFDLTANLKHRLDSLNLHVDLPGTISETQIKLKQLQREEHDLRKQKRQLREKEQDESILAYSLHSDHSKASIVKQI